jgi:hypothetical protein
MGWGDCGVDSKGRPIGYAFEAVCDHPGCNELIDRGLSYACGDMHGEDIASCDGYFCSKHRAHFVEVGGQELAICEGCASSLGPEWEFDDEEGIWRLRTVK